MIAEYSILSWKEKAKKCELNVDLSKINEWNFFYELKYVHRFAFEVKIWSEWFMSKISLIVSIRKYLGITHALRQI